MRIEELQPGKLYVTGFSNEKKHVLCFLCMASRVDYMFYRLSPETKNDKQFRYFNRYSIEYGSMKPYMLEE